MKKKYLVLSVLIIVFCAFVFTACNGDKQAEFYTKLEADIAKTSADYAKVKESFAAAEVYTYTVELYSETLSNFDKELQMMPNDKEGGLAERKKWHKPKTAYTFTKSGGDWYVKSVFTEHSSSEAGYLYSDNKFKNPLYDGEVTSEYWFIANILTVKNNGEQIFSGALGDFDISAAASPIDLAFPDIAAGYVNAFSDTESFSRAVFGTEDKNILGTRVLTYQTYYVVTRGAEGNEIETRYRDSDKAVGYSEDLRFVWKDIIGVYNNTICLSSKKNALQKIEMYTEFFSSYNKTATQIWDNQTVTSWYGDRTAATKAVINIVYPTEKAPISVAL